MDNSTREPLYDRCTKHRRNRSITDTQRAILLVSRLDLSMREIDLLSIELAEEQRAELRRLFRSMLAARFGIRPTLEADRVWWHAVLRRSESGCRLLRELGIE